MQGTLAPTSELDLHLAVLPGRRDAGAVVHTHAPLATALACVLDELPCVHYAMLEFGGSVRVAPYRTFGTPELAAVTLASLADRTAVLMANHGTLAFGATLQQALARTRLLEWACALYLRAAALGPPRVLDEPQLRAAARALRDRAYGSSRLLEHPRPSKRT